MTGELEIAAALHSLGAGSGAAPLAAPSFPDTLNFVNGSSHLPAAHRLGTDPACNDNVLLPSMSSKRSSKVAFEGVVSALHPVVRLGWKTLCHVHCNGLTGKFLGGHDRDLYIRCTSSEYAGAPLVDIAQGGCIMTCSQFEKAAGRELSKKWKESIHVTGEGEGSKATLVAWLKRQAEQRYGEGVVGRDVWICSCSDGQYYRATIISYSKHNGKHKVQYGDRHVEELHLPVELLSFEEQQPVAQPCDALSDEEMAAPPDRLPGPTHGGAMMHPHFEQHTMSGPLRPLGRSISLPGSVANRKFSATTLPPNAGLHHQGSGVSVSSTYDDDDGGHHGAHHHHGIPIKGGRKQERSFRGRVRHEAASRIEAIPEDATTPPLRTTSATTARHPTPPLSLRTPATTRRRPSRAPLGDDDLLPARSPDRRLDSDTPSPPPKRTRSATGAAAAVAAVGAPAAAPSALQHSISLPSSLGGSGRTRAPTPLMMVGGVGGGKPPRFPPEQHVGVVYTPAMLGSVPPPPASGLTETNVRHISVWMNGVALSLDQPLTQALEASPVTSTWSPYEKSLSPSARFQMLLVNARRSSGIHGMYEAMLSRMEMFAPHGPHVLEQKMVEFMLAALHEDSVQATRDMLLLAKQRTPPSSLEVQEQFGSGQHDGQHDGQHVGEQQYGGSSPPPPASPHAPEVHEGAMGGEQ